MSHDKVMRENQESLVTESNEKSQQWKPFGINSRAAVFCCTYMLYALNHSLRQNYSYSKDMIEREYGVDRTFLGFMDASFYLLYGLTITIRYWFGPVNRELIKIAYLSSIVISLMFGLIAFLPFMSEGLKETENSSKIQILFSVILFGAMCIAGISHFEFYQFTCTYMSYEFDIETEGCLYGLWGTSMYVGNIFGYFYSNILIEFFNVDWKVTMLILSIIYLTVAMTAQITLSQLPSRIILLQEKKVLRQFSAQNQTFQNLQLEQEQRVSTKLYFSFISRLFQSRFLLWTILTGAMLMGIYYSFLLWLTVFLKSSGFQKVSGFMSSCFDIGAVVGGILFGLGFQKVNNLDKNTGQISRSQGQGLGGLILRNYCFIALAVLLALLLILKKTEPNLYICTTLILLIGCFLGGLFMVFALHEILLDSGRLGLKLEMANSLIFSVGSISIGLAQIAVSLIFHFQKQNINSSQSPRSNQNDYSGFLYVCFGLIVLCVVFLIIRKREIINEVQVVSVRQNQI